MTFEQLAAQAMNRAIDDVKDVDSRDPELYGRALQSAAIRRTAESLRQAYKDGVYLNAIHKNGELLVGCMEKTYKEVCREIDLKGGPLI